jgi:hypothetical protein
MLLFLGLGGPSDEFIYITGIAGVLALVVAVMALPTVFQMLWGRPKIDIGYSEEKEPSDVLFCTFDQPFVARWLRPLGVRRTPVEIQVTIAIEGQAGNQKVLGFADLRHLDGPQSKFMTVTPSLFPAIQSVIVWRKGDVWRCHKGAKETEILEDGTYTTRILVLYAGTDLAQAQRNFKLDGGIAEWC